MAVADHNRRFARHLLLAEIGEAGQARLCATRVRFEGAPDARAAAVARDYLVRAGVAVSGEHEAKGRVSDGDLAVRAEAGDSVLQLSVLDARGVDEIAGREELEEAAAALAGAFAAVEAIKHAVGCGTPAALPVALRLNAEVSA